MKEEFKIFFTALMFYTRLPCPPSIDHSEVYLNKATRYFPLIGWIVGSLSFLVFWIAFNFFDVPLAVLFSLISGVLITGAFHEDGFADVFDGFGGGWSKNKILEIMKDSRLGTYGVIALIFMFSLKFLALNDLIHKIQNFDLFLIALIFINYHTLARLTALNMVFASQYSREDETTKAKPIAKSYTKKEILIAYFWGLIPLIIFCSIQWILGFVLIPLFLLFYFSKRYFEKWIDGYTGDCLGAIEQFAECICLLTFLILWKFF